MKFRWMLVLFLSAGGLAQTTPWDNTPDKPTGLTVTGRVLQDPGDQPLRKVDVQLRLRDLHGRTTYSQNIVEPYSATTDAEGKFRIENVMPGRYEASLERTGFVQAGKRRRHGTFIDLRSADDAQDVVFKMQAAAVVTGKITDNDGDPLPNVNVQVTRADAHRVRDAHDNGWANTNDLGEYRIGGLRPGNYLITATSSGANQPTGTKQNDPSKGELAYVATYYPGTTDKTQAVPIELHPGDETPASFSLLTSPTFLVHVTVAMPAGAKFAQIMLHSAETGFMAHGDASPRADGAFEFRGLLPGSYTAYLMTFDFSALAENPQNQQPQVQSIRLAPDIEITTANLDGLHLAPEAAGQVHGRFRMDSGQKIDWTQLAVVLTPTDATIRSSGMSFSASSSSGASRGGFSFARVNSDGSFDLKTVAAGGYRLAVTSNSNQLADYFTKAINLEGKDVAESGFSVNGGAYSLEVVVSAAGASIDGKVVGATGDPVSGATVVGAPNGESRKRFDLYGHASTDAQGHFTLRGLNPGEYTVMAWDDPEENARDPETIKLYESRGEKVQLDEGARRSIVVKVIADSE